ncbi:MAG: hypothetical protein U1E70_24395 [Acetobacteraceae bacterium]
MLPLIARNGIWIPPVFVIVGLIIPQAGEFGMLGIRYSAFCIVFFGILTMSPGNLSKPDIGPTVSLTLAATLLAPVFAYAAGQLMRLPLDLQLAMVLVAATPIAQVAGAYAAILDLPDRGPTLAALVTVILAPLAMPLVVHVVSGDALQVSPLLLAERAAVLALLPATMAFVLRSVWPERVTALRLQFRGLVIIALSFISAAMGMGLRLGLEDLDHIVWLSGTTYVVFGCSMLAGWLMSLPFGWREGLAGMFSNATRNLGFVFAAVGADLDRHGLVFISLTIIPHYLLPFLMKGIVRIVRRAPGPALATAIGHRRVG